jgi:DNA-binding IclR family transcriptional regulator
MHGREVIYVIEERARGRAPLVSDVDVRLPSHLTASGRAMLAALPRKQLLALFPDSTAFVSRTGLGPTSMAALNRTLAEVRREGYAVENGEITEHFASVAVAVLDHTSHPVASIAVTFEAASISVADTRSIVRETAAAVDVVQRRLRGRDAVASRPAQ